VFERDGVQCTFVAENGRRCEARAFLELDHAEPKALGGTNEAENLRVRCRAHNQLWAEQVFGREHIERSRHFCQKKCAGDGMNRATTPKSMESLDGDEWTTTFEKARSALRGLGFHDAEARRALATVAGRHDASERFDLAKVVREAVLVATAA
jgi:hypothetical protein